ncbi:ribonuclease H-like domain-containing protein [Tanacetum coccineum]
MCAQPKSFLSREQVMQQLSQYQDFDCHFEAAIQNAQNVQNSLLPLFTATSPQMPPPIHFTTTSTTSIPPFRTSLPPSSTFPVLSSCTGRFHYGNGIAKNWAIVLASSISLHWAVPLRQWNRHNRAIWIIDSLHKEFFMTDLGSLNYFLGISVTRDSLDMFLSQCKYATKILELAHIVGCNPSRNPIDSESKMGDDGDLVSDLTLYQSLAGSLQYLTFSLPDISYAVQQVCLYMHDPREPHFLALKRILRYVRGTLDHGLHLFSSSTTSLVAYSDVDWASCPATRRSTSGYKTEYRGVANVVAEICWSRNVLRELHTPLSSAMLVYCDNVSAVYLSSNPVQHQRAKHIDIDIHFVRDLVAAGQTWLQRIIDSLHKEFSMTDLGSLNYFLGISVTCDSSEMFLSQRKNATKILERAHMVGCNPSRTPIDTEFKLGDDGDPVSYLTLYRSLARSLQYLTFSRPNISYAVQQVCLYMHDPSEPHFSALKRILRYVRGTLDHGLHLFSSSTTSLVAYSDVDWAGCLATRRSTSGYRVFFGNNLLSWSSKRQPTLSRSSAEAEYRVLPMLLLRLVGRGMFYVNCIHLCLPLRLFTVIIFGFCWSGLRSSCSISLSVADIFIKGLPSALFEEFRFSLSVWCPPAPTAGEF